MEEYRVPNGAADRRDPAGASPGGDGATPKAMPVGQISTAEHARWPTDISELDRVLGGSDESGKGGGLVPGSVVLLGGDPGIGKSTLLMQALDRMAQAGRRCLYVTTEESAQQTRMRAERVGCAGESLFILADTNLARVVEQVRQVDPEVIVLDSIQMIYKGDLDAAPGTVSQLRACCMAMVRLAKVTGAAVMLVGHVTKEGQLAGPRLLEHMVDTVLYFEGDRYHSHRIVRATKNRFGATLEVGLFEMGDGGLREVTDGAALLAAEYRSHAATPGSVVCPVMSGSRCLLVELQALTATGFLGAAKRKANGLDTSRLAMLIAVLEKHGGLRLADQDVFVSTVGGMRIAEPAADLALALAIAGAHYSRPLGDDQATTCAVGEIGLDGQVRHVGRMDQRIREASRLGFRRILCGGASVSAPRGCEVVNVLRLGDAIDHLVG